MDAGQQADAAVRLFFPGQRKVVLRHVDVELTQHVADGRKGDAAADEEANEWTKQAHQCGMQLGRI